MSISLTWVCQTTAYANRALLLFACSRSLNNQEIDYERACCFCLRGINRLRYWESHAVKALEMANTISMSLHALPLSIIHKQSWHEWKPPSPLQIRRRGNRKRYDPCNKSLMGFTCICVRIQIGSAQFP